MDLKPCIDILLATCNGRKYLQEQIDSILAQSYDNWRLLIRDDCSDDDTAGIIEAFVTGFPDRIYMVENGGVRLGASLNFQCLLEHSTAEYIMFCDQDDIWLPSKIEKTLNLMKATEKTHPDMPVLVHSDLTIVDSELRVLSQSMWRSQGLFPGNCDDVNKLVLKNVVTGCTVMINKKAKEVSMPVPSEAVMHDWWIAIKVARHGKIVYLPDQLVLYRQHSDNTIGVKKRNIFSARKRIISHYKMIKKHDSQTAFLPFVSRKIVNKIVHRYAGYKFH